MSRDIILRAITFVFTAATATLVCAQLPSNVEVATELMIENQTSNAAFIGAMFGADPSSALNFTSNVDPSGNSFSYTLTPGSTYLGQNATLSGTGSFDPSMTVMTFSSSGSLGSNAWSTSGTDTIAPIAGGYTDSSMLALAAPANFNDTHREITIGTVTSKAVGYLTNNGVEIPGSSFNETDSINPFTGKWRIDWEVKSTVSSLIGGSEGLSPAAGGAGAFTMIVPEPSSIVLLLFAILALAGAMPRGRRRRAST